jgi:hypothetical protein
MEAKLMRKLSCLALVALFAALTANAQTKIAGKASCSKPETSYTIDVGDRPGHALMLQKAECKWTVPLEIEGMHSQNGTDVTSADAIGSTIAERGYHTAVMDSGDKFTVQYQGSIKANKDGSASFNGKWAFVQGTGKLKGIKGSGIYRGTGMADGSGDIEVEGEYALATAKVGK